MYQAMHWGKSRCIEIDLGMARELLEKENLL